MIPAIQSCDGGNTGQPKVPGSIHQPKNVGSAGPVKLLPDASTVATHQPVDAGNRASASPAGDDIDAQWPHRMAAANRLLIEENARLKAQVAVGEEAVYFIESVMINLNSKDLARARTVFCRWKEAGRLLDGKLHNEFPEVAS